MKFKKGSNKRTASSSSSASSSDEATPDEPRQDSVEQPTPDEPTASKTPNPTPDETPVDAKPNSGHVTPSQRHNAAPHGARNHQATFHHNNQPSRTYQRIAVDPSRKYHQPEERESWGHNVKGKKFRKEKGKKKRNSNAGLRIDGSVKSIRFN